MLAMGFPRPCLVRRFLVAVLPLLFACDRATPLPAQHDAGSSGEDDVVATVNGSRISADEFRRELVRHGADFLEAHRDEPFKRRVLEDLVRTRVLAEAARREGMAELPEIKEELDRLLAETYWRDKIAGAGSAPEVTSDEIESFYRKHEHDYREPERARGSVILLRKPADAGSDQIAPIREAAARIRDEAAATPGRFGELAREKSDDPATRARGGDMGFVVRGATVFRWDPPVTEALFALSPGEVSPVIEADRGYYIVKLVEKQGGEKRPLEDVVARVRQELSSQQAKERQAALYDELRRGVDVEINSEIFEKTGPPPAAADGSRPPSFPLDADSQG
jgi:hypothetical protein